MVHEKRVCIVYRKPLNWIDSAIQLIGRCGNYTHCELWFPDYFLNGKKGYRFTNFMFQTMERTDDAYQEYMESPDMYDVHIVWLPLTAYMNLFNWCDELVSRKCRYNYSAVARLILPQCMQAVDDPELDMNHLNLFCSQAIVLSFLKNIPTDHPISGLMRKLPACATKPQDVANVLEPLYGPPLGIYNVAPDRVQLPPKVASR
jgi:hypothetical protein